MACYKGIDPHHPDIEWMYNSGSFFTRKLGGGKFTQVKRFHATPARISFLYNLMNGTSSFKINEI